MYYVRSVTKVLKKNLTKKSEDEKNKLPTKEYFMHA